MRQSPLLIVAAFSLDLNLILRPEHQSAERAILLSCNRRGPKFLTRNEHAHHNPLEDVDHWLAVQADQNEHRGQEHAGDVAANLGPAQLAPHHERVQCGFEPPGGWRQARVAVRGTSAVPHGLLLGDFGTDNLHGDAHLENN